jgi:hypothetical protein
LTDVTYPLRDSNLLLEKVRSFDVRLITIQEATTIIKEWHYSHSTNGLLVSYCFGLFFQEHLIGSMIYGHLGMANVWKKYAKQKEDVIELRRLACIDDTPKNTESYFIGKTLRWLKKNTPIKVVVSYADTFHGHAGTIYKASNFKHVGMTSPGKVILDSDGRTFHDKAIRTTYVNAKGEKNLKPFAQRLKSRLESGEAQYINTPGKHIYLYNLTNGSQI